MSLLPVIDKRLNSGLLTMCPAVKVTARADRGGDSVRYVAHTKPLTINGEEYDPAPFEASRFQRLAGVTPDNQTFTIMLGDPFDRITLVGGKWTGARIVVMLVDYTAPELGPIHERRGYLGEVPMDGKLASPEFRGMMQLLGQEIGDLTSKTCRYQLGDEDCGLDLTAFTFTGTVTAVDNDQKFTVSVSEDDHYFRFGKVTFDSGENEGLSQEILDSAGQVLTLFQPMFSTVAIGDEITLIAGDDKTLKTCAEKFDNAVNHGAEALMPNRDDVFTFPE